ncbi:MAG: hypothetical protein ACLQRH_27825 [Acidimicrobiales bacterium]
MSVTPTTSAKTTTAVTTATFNSCSVVTQAEAASAIETCRYITPTTKVFFRA